MASKKTPTKKTKPRAKKPVAGKASSSRKPATGKTAPRKKSGLKARLVAMEKSLEKGAADLGRRVKAEMPAVKARVARAGKAVAKLGA